MAKVLVSDPVAAEGVAILRRAGLEVDVRTGLSGAELKEIIGEYEGLAVRSETKVTAEILEAAHKLKIIGRAGVGVDNIDVPKATEKGILVVNSPEGNTIAAAELTVALFFALSRSVPQAHQSMKAGEWKRSKFVGVELYGKTAGVIGLGKIGREVAKRLKAMEMPILAYDPFLGKEQAEALGVQLVDLDTLYRNADFITVHVPKTKETTGLISDAQLAVMKDGVRLINVARGGIYDEAALLRGLESGKIGGAALDVWESEPVAPDSPLALHPKVVATPHLGASTEEAQVGVAVDIAEQIVAVLQGGSARAAVNMPSLPAEILHRTAPYLTLAEKMGSLKAQLARGSVTAVEIRYEGEFDTAQTVHLTRAVLKGLLVPALGESVNYVNAPALAASRGVKVTESRGPRSDDYERQITVLATDDRGTHAVTGTVFGKNDPHIVFLDTYPVDFRPSGHHIMVRNHDRPGMIGKIGTILGEGGVNIAGMYVGRDEKDGTAVMALSVDTAASPEVTETIRSLDGILSVRHVVL
ncbi:phosphoglycerate dehydrogenase [Armatimonas rosea]|uniref:D-3-phosphoglycerate dehydrogenase n=1 Tax=Armatimonas rosea TaxID=685828 RepID=A0A7W9SRX9_ARMRO|nr:phosphoglycerate dehydrogenase [Armatimonas rosea]MBB6051732.1 D-3-phosphoglycerate dehydrogenase [Armatimonas rosea]